jgi:hypothetical protein
MSVPPDQIGSVLPNDPTASVLPNDPIAAAVLPSESPVDGIGIPVAFSDPNLPTIGPAPDGILPSEAVGVWESPLLEGSTPGLPAATVLPEPIGAALPSDPRSVGLPLIPDPGPVGVYAPDFIPDANQPTIGPPPNGILPVPGSEVLPPAGNPFNDNPGQDLQMYEKMNPDLEPAQPAQPVPMEVIGDAAEGDGAGGDS